MLQLAQLANFLNAFFRVQEYAEDVGGIYRPSTRPIHRIGLALEPEANLAEWVEQHQLDALFLHRPWQVALESLPSDLGIVSYHLAFDHQLTLGLNPRLATVLSMAQVEPFGEKAGHPIGMIGQIPAQSLDCYYQQVNDVFGGWQSVQAGSCDRLSQVAVVGAMSDDLIRQAALQGVEVYITGQFRSSAKAAVVQTGIGVIEVGHRRSEEWGLRSLAGLLQERWATLEVQIAPSITITQGITHS